MTSSARSVFCHPVSSFDSNDGAETKARFFQTCPPTPSVSTTPNCSAASVSLLSNKAAAVRLLKNEDPTVFHRNLCSFDST